MVMSTVHAKAFERLLKVRLPGHSCLVEVKRLDAKPLSGRVWESQPLNTNTEGFSQKLSCMSPSLHSCYRRRRIIILRQDHDDGVLLQWSLRSQWGRAAEL